MTVYRLTLPVSKEQLEELRVGDTVYLTGVMVTARDQTHRKILELVEKGEKPPINLEGLAVYHCGPVVARVEKEWRVVAAGPTTSYRMGMLVPRLVSATGARIVVGKGGLPPEAARALREAGGVYLAFPGGAGALAAKSIERVEAVYWLEELGVPEAMWVFRVKDFGPATVAIDLHGGNIYEEVARNVAKRVEEVKERLRIFARRLTREAH